MDVRVRLWRKLSAEELMVLCWRRLLRVPWTAGRSNQSIQRRSVLSVLWKEWCWSWNCSTLASLCEELTHWKRPWCWEGLGAEGEGTTDDEMTGWHHRLNGHEFEWTPRVVDGQGGLVCCDSWGCKELDTTERLNWTELNVCMYVNCNLLIYPTPSSTLGIHKFALYTCVSISALQISGSMESQPLYHHR